MTSPNATRAYRGATLAFGTVAVGLGIAILATTLSNGGGPLSVGFIFGVLFIVLGLLRLYLLRVR